MRKEVKFNYFMTADHNVRNNPTVDLSGMFDAIIREYEDHSTPKVYIYRGERSKLESIQKDGDLYFLVLERLRNTDLPVRTKVDAGSEELGLQDDEYLGEQVVILYDSTNDAMMVQRNIHSLSPRGIEFFIASLIEEYVENDIDFRMVLLCDRNVNRDRLALTTRKLVFRGDQDSQFTGVAGSIFEAVNRNFNEEESSNDYTVEVIVTAKDNVNSENPYLPESLVHEVINQNDGFSKLSVKARNPYDELEEVNLLNHKLADSHVFEISQNNRRIYPAVIIREMRNIYETKGRGRIA